MHWMVDRPALLSALALCLATGCAKNLQHTSAIDQPDVRPAGAYLEQPIVLPANRPVDAASVSRPPK